MTATCWAVQGGREHLFRVGRQFDGYVGGIAARLNIANFDDAIKGWAIVEDFESDWIPGPCPGKSPFIAGKYVKLYFGLGDREAKSQ